MTVLTDEQRALIRGYFDEHPDGGYKSACRHAGIVPLTKAEAKDLIEQDEELAEYRLQKLKLDVGSLFQRLGEMAQDSDHRDQFRAITFGLTAIHGYGAQRVEVTGAEGGPVGVEIDGGRVTGIAAVIELAARLGVAGAAVGLGAGAARGALPAASGVLPDPGDG